MTRALMIQGTTSNAGKSFTVAALCRILAQDGYKVAPFKSQNMALNSFITYEGLEMGRAQVMQAEAAGVEPQVAMNPILLKPTGDTGSQVIVNGEVLDNMEATAYFAYKHKLKPAIMEAYHSLAQAADIIVIEGAGSPAEINLKHGDIVNMGMAKMAQAPVVIVGDINLGGVFASLYGTVALLEPEEQALVKATLINKFRGDKSLLDSGLVQLEELTGKPVLGVVPFMRLDIDDEDSLSQRIEQHSPGLGPIDIAVIRLLHLSNFTDLNPLSRFPQVSVRYVERPEQLGTPDLVVLPGTKNTMDDLAWLRKTQLDKAICACAQKGTLVLGICGGYQMLGTRLADPQGVEAGGTMEGLGLLPMQTMFTSAKTRTRVQATTGHFGGSLARLSSTTLAGYEIHMGETTLDQDFLQSKAASDSLKPVPFATLAYHDGRPQTLDGCVWGNVIGSYCHGMFEDGTFAKELVALLCAAKGIEPQGFPEETFSEYKNRQYDALAQGVRENIDMDLLYRIIEDGV